MIKAQETANSSHGSYDNILSEKEVLSITTSVDKCIVHFYHKKFKRCQIMDRHLGVSIKFISNFHMMLIIWDFRHWHENISKLVL